MTDLVITVTGEVSKQNLGVTLFHEHILHQISISSGKPDNTCVDRDVIVDELLRFRAAGGGTICDVTPAGLGRDPDGLRQVSQRSGVKIISGFGLYLEKDFPEEARNLSQKKLTDYIVRQVDGESTNIRAGLIGEIASHNENHSDWRKYQLTRREDEIFRAVADAQKRTGLSISTHASMGRAGVAQVQSLLNAGANPERVIIGHCDAQSHEDVEIDLDYYHRLLKEGVMLSFDLFGWEELMPDKERCRRIGLLVREGFLERILISTDTCRCSQLHRFGGRGFDYLFPAFYRKELARKKSSR
jgi:predicted metal-dependent phosphotriesterase family hydrolase